MKRLLCLLFALALPLPCHAQGAYDLILPTDVGLPGSQSSPGAGFGILVNTGTEPLYVGEWSFSTGFARTDQLWAPYELRAHHAGPSSLFTLHPGAAVGSGTPEMLALLGANEWIAASSTPVLLVRYGPELPPAGPVGCEGVLRSRVFADGLEREVRFGLRIHSTSGAEPELRGAQRISSTVVAPLIEEVPMGCSAPGLGALGVHLVAPHDPTLAPSRIGYGSSLPMLGNEHTILGATALYDPQYEGSPWILIASRDGATVTFGGCEVLRPGPTTTVLGGGVYTSQPQHPQAQLDTVPFPIPDSPALAGHQLTLQMLLLTPAAPNGRCAASEGLRLTFGSL